MVEPGRRMLGDRYELSGLIASGGMGQVWRATDLLLHRPVAVKVLRSEYTGDPTFLARFRAEAQHAAALSHPNIAAVYDYGETEAADTGERLAYLVMELVEGRPLSTLLRQEGALDTATTLSVLGQTAAALAEAHRAGLVHRDVKPGNILVRPDGSVKITDFGIAWSAGSVPLTQTGQVIGTPQYISPEQAEGHLATPASDVYGLGLVGYECLTGHPAFDGDNAITIALKQLRSDPEPLPDTLPGDVRTLIRRALAKDPAARMADGAAFVAAVEDARAGRLPADFAAPLAAPAPAAVPAAAPSPAPAVDPGPATQAAPAPAGSPRSGAAPRRGSPPPPSRRRAAAVLVPLIALLLGAGLAAVVFTALDDGAAPPPVVAAQTRDGEEGVVLEAGDYVGRPIDDVATQLSALGLGVERRQQVTDAAVPGLVIGISPAGVALEPGDDVVVTYAVAPPSRDPGTWERDDDRGEVSTVTGDSAPGPDAEPLPAAPGTAAVTSAPAPPETPSATPTGTPDPSPSPDPTATAAPGETTTSEAPTTTADPTPTTPSATSTRPASPSSTASAAEPTAP
ncbi:serine/threonine protein kinase [Geodermatophilus dictyosporus]|uniref:non-specific serine/threonine protein kinase n=1 Tax=Geodermatophilus dictyosporus TaxID=1523247 RepID=A0A1I5SDJ9_9ACTN|nr:serine/threonine protein kinase [Geodermatophilus dictyosporus]SFP68824.1 serine/threonine protein kinase [Geodermatophilus dictyosporus]